jgi:signal transduction histidine kinase
MRGEEREAQRPWGAVAVLGLSLLLFAAGFVLTFLNRSSAIPPGIQQGAALTLGLIPYPMVGALILARRPGHPIGRLFVVFGLAGAIDWFGEQFGIYGLFTSTNEVPGAQFMLWVSRWMDGIAILAFLLILLLFPDGHLLSRRWVPVLWFIVVSLFGFVLTGMFSPSPLVTPEAAPGFPQIDNPFAVAFLRPIGEGEPFWLGILIGFLAASTSLVLRYRRTPADEREPIKWFAFTGLLAGITVFVALNIENVDASTWYQVVIAVALGLVPVGAGIGILRHRLYDIDLVIRRTVVFGLLVAFITTVYVAVVVGVGRLVGGEDNLALSLVATAIVVVALEPVRTWARRLANRLVYGRRANPYEVLSAFSRQASETYALEEALPKMAELLGRATGARRAGVWLVVGDELRPAAQWPGGDGSAPVPVRGSELPPIEGEGFVTPVRHRGELLGALTVAKPAAEPVTPADEKLAVDLASQGGLLLRNARLTAELMDRLVELRASRQRIVAAQDEERRRLERNIHDGAQQQLVALAVKARLAEAAIGHDVDRERELVAQLGLDATDALENLRELARGIYPPLLADRGLVEALSAQARKSPLAVTVESGRLGRYPRELEAAAYFCCLEALQNAAKYAGVGDAVVRLTEEDDAVVFVVEDSGAGFDPGRTPYGSGLRNMADRVEALGGTLEVRSIPGRGTRVVGRLPVPPDPGAEG